MFVDTSAFIAFLDADDSSHRSCREAWEHVVRDAEVLVTTDYNVVESVAVTQRRWGLDAVRTMVDEYLPLVEVEDVTSDERDAALAALLAAGRRQLNGRCRYATPPAECAAPFSLVDCVSFGVMRRRGIRRYLGVDPHFAEQGFTPIAKTSE